MVIATGMVAGIWVFASIILGAIFGMVAGVLAFLAIIAPFAWLFPSTAG